MSNIHHTYSLESNKSLIEEYGTHYTREEVPFILVAKFVFNLRKSSSANKRKNRKIPL